LWVGSFGYRWVQRTPAIAAKLTDHQWTPAELLNFKVPPPRWTLPGHRGRSFAGSALVAATSTETGDNEAQIDVNVEGEPIEIAFNVRYMTDVLNVIDTPQVALETTSAMEPGVLKPVGDNDFIHIIMPMHFGR